jgi:predicted RNase H-like nuclease (RuvC/YqgF family)
VYDKSAVENIEQLILDMKESLEREIRALERKMDQGFAQINSRFDLQAQRLDRHAALWQTGRRWSSKMDVWAEGVDTALEAKDREISELRARLDRLERAQQNGKQ